ncbi:MAG: ATP-binding protein, partial [Nitrososphaera sp.]|nr:ATP-binding protein [Nitrososphaera sp.]
MKPPASWKESDIVQLIKNKAEESINLDFKEAGALLASDKAKLEISKDVSAFANSAGGAIIYGIKESNTRPYYASAVSPVDPAAASKEWLEQVINSRIQPRIQAVHINPIKLGTQAPGKFVYAVTIPESFTAHQASDKRYYKRFNFESVPMEDYEVRQAMTRASRPAYQFQLSKLVLAQGNPIRVRFIGVLQNMSEIVGHAVSLVLFAPKELVEHPDDYATDVA